MELFAGQPTSQIFSRQPLLSGQAGTVQTIKLMRQLVDAALRDPSIIRLATDIVRHIPAFDDLSEVRGAYDWVKSNIRFTKDPVNKEKLYPPAELLKIRAGDCDDISMMLGTLVMALGYPARLITVSANSSSPDQFSHVYVEAQVHGSWIPMDAARAGAEFGVEPPFYYRKRAWSLSDDSYSDLSGLGNFPMTLGAPRYRRHLGDAAETSSMIATISNSEANLIRAYEGQPASPWNSFQTPYTPGAAPPAGYAVDPTTGQLQLTATASASSPLIWIGLGAAVLLMMTMRGRS